MCGAAAIAAMAAAINAMNTNEFPLDSDDGEIICKKKYFDNDDEEEDEDE